MLILLNIILKIFITYWRSFFKVVLLPVLSMSCMHHSAERDGETQNLVMITFYNSTIGSVDSLDQISTLIILCNDKYFYSQHLHSFPLFQKFSKHKKNYFYEERNSFSYHISS